MLKNNMENIVLNTSLCCTICTKSSDFFSFFDQLPYDAKCKYMRSLEI